MVKIMSNTSASNKYIKAIVVKLDPFESQILFEKNYSYDETNEAQRALSEYDCGNNICQAYEMDIDMN